MSIWLNPIVWFVEKTLNPLLQSEQKNTHLLNQLKGKRIGFRCESPVIFICMDVTEQGTIRLFSDNETHDVDLELSGTAKQWAKQATSMENSQLLVSMKGDVQIAATLHELLQSFDIDWGALLEPYTGSQVSYVAHSLLKGAHKQANRLFNTLSVSTREYIQHECNVSVSKNEAEYFYSEVDQLNAKYERLAARLARITNTTS